MVHTLVCWDSQCLHIASLAPLAPAERQWGLLARQACIFEGLADKVGFSYIAGFVFLGKKKASLSVPLLKHVILKNENSNCGMWIAATFSVLDLSLYSCPFQSSLAALPIKDWSLFPHALEQGWPYDLLWPMQNVAEVLVCDFRAQEALFEPTLSAYHHHVNKPGLDEGPCWGKPSCSILGHPRPTCSQPTPKHLREPRQDQQSYPPKPQLTTNARVRPARSKELPSCPTDL